MLSLSWIFTKSVQYWSNDQFITIFSIFAAIFHHFSFQYPIQAKFFSTFYGHIAIISTFLLLSNYVRGLQGLFELCKSTAIFSFLYVYYYLIYWITDSKISATIILKIIYNIAFRHRNIPGSIWYKATDWAFWWSFRHGRSYLQIEAFHQKFGILSSSKLISFSRWRCTHRTEPYKFLFYSCCGSYSWTSDQSTQIGSLQQRSSITRISSSDS